MAHAYSKLYIIPSTGLRFLQYTDPQVVSIWRIGGLPISLSKMTRFKSSIMETENVILHMSMI